MEKKVPLRRCVGCGEHKPKKELVRIVRDTDGSFCVDLTGKKNGRGAYICPSEACFQRARKTRALERALETTISPEVFDALEEQLRRGG